MKILVALMMLVAMMAMGIEEPEPEWSNELYGYECEIAFGSKDSLVWQSVPVVFTQILPQVLDDHFYGITVVGGNRRVYWGVETPNSTEENPEVIKIGIHMPPMPHWWGIYRVRFRPFPVVDPDGWSTTSYWTAIIDLNALPAIGPASALVD